MRTTLDISDDVLFAAKELARHDKRSLGQIISELARQALANPAGAMPATDLSVAAPSASERLAAYGIEPLPSRGGIVCNELIDRLHDSRAS